MNEELEMNPQDGGADPAKIKIAYTIMYPDGTDVTIAKTYDTRVDCVETDLYVYLNEITQERLEILNGLMAEDAERKRTEAAQPAAEVEPSEYLKEVPNPETFKDKLANTTLGGSSVSAAGLNNSLRQSSFATHTPEGEYILPQDPFGANTFGEGSVNGPTNSAGTLIEQHINELESKRLYSEEHMNWREVNTHSYPFTATRLDGEFKVDIPDNTPFNPFYNNTRAD